jgi:hypothetical protein
LMFSLVIFIINSLQHLKTARCTIRGLKAVYHICADEGTRTPTSLRHKILSLARLPITTHPHKTGAKVQKNIILTNRGGYLRSSKFLPRYTFLTYSSSASCEDVPDFRILPSKRRYALSVMDSVSWTL